MFRSNDPSRFSLKRRIVAVVLVAACIVWAALGVAVYRAILHASAVEFDERLMQQARVILLYADHEYAETKSVLGDPAERQRAGGAPDVVYQIWTAGGQLIYRSSGSPIEPLAALDTQGFRDVNLPGGAWRAYGVRSTSSPLIVEVAEPAEHRRHIAARVLNAVMIPVILALPVLALLVYVLTRAALRPIQRFADRIGARDANDLRPLAIERMPDETRALGSALNDLFERYGRVLARESRFTGDAAHELRTPLAAVRAQAQVALRARDPTESAAALGKLITGVDRANRLVTQLLALSRLESSSGRQAGRSQPLAFVLETALHDLGELAQSRQVSVDCGPMPALLVPEEPTYLLLRNLLDNALRHSPPAGIVRVRSWWQPARLVLEIADDGPGIPPELRAQVLERFFRHDSRYDGSGLGLSIVACIVELLRGELRLEATSGSGGLTVRIELPLAAGAAGTPVAGEAEPAPGADPAVPPPLREC